MDKDKVKRLMEYLSQKDPSYGDQTETFTPKEIYYALIGLGAGHEYAMEVYDKART